MRRFGSAVAVVLILTMMAPALACAAGRAMGSSERACCKSMHGHCGDMAGQGCCQPELRSDVSQPPVPVTSTPLALPVVLVAVVYPPSPRLYAAEGYRRSFLRDHSPPGLLIADSTVLRI